MFWILGLLFLLGALAIIFFRASFLIVQVDGGSMFPTLQHGDRLLVYRFWSLKLLRRNQLVVVNNLFGHSSDEICDNNNSIPALLIKRVAALPGEFVTNPTISAPGASNLNERARTQIRLGDNQFGVIGDASLAEGRTSPPMFIIPNSELVGVAIIPPITNKLDSILLKREQPQ